VDVSGEPGVVVERIAAAVAGILALGKLPVVLGGEHTVTWGVIQGYLSTGHRDIGVVQLDAHADLRDTYEGDPLSHACVMRRVVEAGVSVFQLGTPALCQEKVAAREHFGVGHLDGEVLVPGRITEVPLPDDFPAQVFFTLDADGIDPSVIPATGTPVPGGAGWYQTLALVESVARQRRIVGFDIMELAPIPSSPPVNY
jgi:agmatinase